MKKHIIILIFMTITLQVFGQDYIVQSISTTCSGSYGPVSNAIDLDYSTFFSYSGYLGCNFNMTVHLSRTVKAVKIKIKASGGGIDLGNYYTTQTTDEEFYYVNPSDFSTLYFTMDESPTSYYVYEVEVYELDINTAGIPLTYDACGNMISRVLYLSVGTQQKSAEADEEFQKDMLDGKTIKLYPNPTDGEIRMHIDGIADEDEISYKLYSANGELIQHKQQLTDETLINIINEPSGLYVLKIQINSEVQQWTIIKK